MTALRALWAVTTFLKAAKLNSNLVFTGPYSAKGLEIPLVLMHPFTLWSVPESTQLA